MSIRQPPPHLCASCGHHFASNPDGCVACQKWAAIEAINIEKRKAAVMRQMQNAANNVPAGRAWRYVAPGRA